MIQVNALHLTEDSMTYSLVIETLNKALIFYFAWFNHTVNRIFQWQNHSSVL